MSEPNQTAIDREIEIDNAIERERVRAWWEDRAPVLAGLVMIGVAVCCIICRGGVQ